ncbi:MULTISPECIES: LysR family transcriptional regulator [unclassified Rhizobium]|uniref:LysR family transcriptional regulator n=1 Tax=unclassified Rhizobium TaxID=2613769 RepID=UPI000DD5EB17|nr:MULTISPECIES: LysR family transcriptional regulator [unclassified Rhizobium]MDM9645947.1 LysR family transcriptional regulator [Rhizobium sp. S163]
MKFDLIDLRIFLAAVDGGSLTAAARQNNVVVAAVSARLRRLEEAFDLELFERTGRGIKPTLAGEMLASHARQILDDARRIEADLDAFADGRSGHVRLLSNTNMLAEHLPQALGAFLAASPDISVSVEDKPSLEAVNLLKQGQADIAIVASSADMTGLERFRFVPDRLVLIAPRDLDVPFDAVAFPRILDFKLVGQQGNPALMQFLGRQANELGRTPHFRLLIAGFEATCRVVEQGAGVSIIPESAARRYAHFMNLKVVPISEPWADRELYVCVRNEMQLPGYARMLLAHLKHYVQTFDDGR